MTGMKNISFLHPLNLSLYVLTLTLKKTQRNKTSPLRLVLWFLLSSYLSVSYCIGWRGSCYHPIFLAWRKAFALETGHDLCGHICQTKIAFKSSCYWWENRKKYLQATIKKHKFGLVSFTFIPSSTFAVPHDEMSTQPLKLSSSFPKVQLCKSETYLW